MSWAVSVNERWEQREKQQEQLKNEKVKRAIGKLDGYDIVKSALGKWYLMKNGKILSTESYPELYMHLKLCENYLTDDQFSEEELHVNKFQVLFVPGIGTLPNVGGKVVNVVQGIIKAGGAIKLGKDSLDKINNAPILNASETEWEKDNRVPKDNETVLKEKEFKKTKKKVKGAVVYEKDGKFYHRDTFHKGKGSHLEVYDKLGNHLGEADPETGEILPGTRDKNKKLPK